MTYKAEASRPLKIFIGWDPREEDAWEVCAHSLRRHASIPIEIAPLKQPELRQKELYWRQGDPLASTAFTYTRFLTPYLAGYKGLAVFCDCDFLWTADIADLVAYIDTDMAVSCVQHDHRPTETVKMQGAVQSHYPRKNWSSLMVFNASHPSVQRLDLETVNTQTGAYLHRMAWAADDEIGAIPQTWNWLEGWSSPVNEPPPKAIHFTRGGPWFAEWQDVEFADLWRAELALVKKQSQR